MQAIATEVAERLDCVRLSAAFTSFDSCGAANKSADKSDALQTLRAVRDASEPRRHGLQRSPPASQGPNFKRHFPLRPRLLTSSRFVKTSFA